MFLRLSADVMPFTVELGLMSTTAAREMAIAYRFDLFSVQVSNVLILMDVFLCSLGSSGLDKQRATMLEIEAGRIDIGASIQVSEEVLQGH
jgi:hypothetical protein